jgi:hypothetical protein
MRAVLERRTRLPGSAPYIPLVSFDDAGSLHDRNRRRGSISVAADVTASLHGDGVVFLHAVEGRLFSANRVGADIWRGVARGLDVEAIAREIAHGYGIAYDTALTDSERFLAELERHRLVAESTAR